MKRFPPRLTKAIDKIKYLKIRSGDHRFIHVWVVIVDGRVLVRSWNDKVGGWYRAFLEEPRGAIVVGEREIPVRASPLKSAKLNDAVDEAYARKYTTKANFKYTEGFKSAKRKATTTELVPLA
jgi:hypothetical protein